MDTAIHRDIEISLGKLVDEALKNNIFSGCCVGVIDGRKKNCSKEIFYYGKTDLKSDRLIDGNTVFDLASLTKPLVTVLSIFTLVRKGFLSLDHRVTKYLGTNEGSFEDITVLHLMEHNSGLVAHREFFRTLITLDENCRKKRLEELIELEQPGFPPGEREVYSDLGYILLGWIVERISGKTLSQFWEDEICTPLQLQNSLFFTKNEKEVSKVFSSTGVCQWSNMDLSGLVNDDNCRSIGGVAGHAGLFGTGDGVITLVKTLLESYTGSYSHSAIFLEPLRERIERNRKRWVLGFDTPGDVQSSSGTYFSRETIGHLGFTGTSFWLDLSKKIGVVVLTNRVLCGEDLSGIQAFRPAVHDLIMEKLMGESDEN